MVGNAPEYRVVGSIRGADAKRLEWRKAAGVLRAAGAMRPLNAAEALNRQALIGTMRTQGDCHERPSREI